MQLVFGRSEIETKEVYLKRVDAARAEKQCEKRKRITREDYARAEADLKKAVAEGKISEEDARTRLNGMRRAIAGQAKRGDDKREVDWDAIKKKIEGAVERGDLTREEADAKYRAIKKRMAGEDHHRSGRDRDK
ncbi:MAG: hypothetical protein ACYTBZ_11385 [Planctomycetota bacterium]|jgi:polyhydroxyalkanoate synthesis regulator phasin